MIDHAALAAIIHPRAIILHGSAAAGGFRPGMSDLDLLVVAEEPLTDPQIAAVESFARTADLHDAAGLDLHVITAAVARNPTPAPPLELHVGRYVNDLEILARQPGFPDLLAELSMARAHGISLTGAAPHEVLGPVPRAWVIARGRHWLRTWQDLTDDRDHITFMRQTAFRIWHYAATALIDDGEVVGAVVRTQTRVKPVFVSPGHRIGLDDCISLTVRLSGRYRIPEPTRQADIVSRKMLREWR